MNRVGRYEIAEPLGQGGMGTVYKAFDPLLARVVAVKLISTQLDSAPEQRERFFREARAAAQLSHRNIITIYDLGEQDGAPFLAMEYLVGRDLDKRMHAPESMSLARKLEIALGICTGLAHAHANGVIHRDIKPANVFLTQDGQIKILDFGLARLMTSDLTRSNVLVGTVNYMAPELLRSERSDHRSDIFSFGVLLYELLSGRRPFQADSVASTMYKILQEMPEPLERVDPTLPPHLAVVVERTLAKAREDRYQQMTDVLRELENAYEPLRGSDRRIIEQVESALHSSITPLPAPRSDDYGSSPDAPTIEAPRPPTGSAKVAVRPPSGSAVPVDRRTPTGVPLPPVPPGPASGEASTPPAAPATAPVTPSSRRLAIVIAAIAIAVAALAVVALRNRAAPTPVQEAATSRPASSEPTRSEPTRSEPPPSTPAEAGGVPPAPVQPPAPPTTAPEPDAGAPRDTDAIASRAARSARQARVLLDAGRLEDAARAASEALALDRSNREARDVMTRITAEERSHVAAALRALDAAKSSAVAVNARDLAAEVFTAAERQEALGRSANSRQQYLAAATSLDAATTLYKSAERTAHAELEARAARARAEESRRRAEQVEARPEPLPTAPVSQPPAPAPPRPPRPEPAAPAPPPGPSPQEAVSAAVQRYVLALQNRDMPSLKAVWPGLGGQDQAAIQAEFDNARSIDVEFVNPRIDINGTAATVTGVRRYSLRTRDNQQLRKDTLTTLSLRQSGNAWLIESVRHQAR